MTTAPAPAPALARPRAGRAGTGLLCAAVGAAVLAAVALHLDQRGLPLNAGVTDWWLTWVTAATGFTGAGAWLAARSPGNPVGRLLLLVGALSATALLGIEYGVRSFSGDALPLAGPLFWLANVTWAVALLVIAAVLPLLLPDGRLPSPRWRPALAVAWTAAAVSGIGWAVTPYEEAAPALAGIDNPTGLDLAAHPAVLAVGGAVILAGPVVGVAGLVLRWRRSAGDERRQLKWVLYGLALSLVLFAGGFVLGPAVTALALLPFPAGCAVAAVRHGMWDVDLVISRSLVWGALTACVVVAYVAVVGGLGATLGRTTGAPLVATALVAVAVEPLHRRLRTLVNRLVHGEAEDPFTALARLGERLESAADAGTVADRMLPELVASIAAALRLPHAAVELADGTTVAHGTPGPAAERLPLQYGAREVGALLVTPRPGGLGRGDRALLGRLARQAAVAGHGLLLAHEVSRSRREVVTAREEERRRLYRELHDGVGPSLAALALTVETARDLVDEDPERARELLDRAVPRLGGAIGDVRAAVNGLRPAPLDDLGLPEAIRELATRFGDGRLRVRADLPEGVSTGLAAATEVAAYRIVAESLANVSRHADAATATVSLRRAGSTLLVEVADDGRGMGPADGGGLRPAVGGGLRPAVGSGLGVPSMRARAAEIGGRLEIGPGPGGRGVRVRAELPAGAP